eukprot:1134139-Pelagomonas_calceolata.AAC.1
MERQRDTAKEGRKAHCPVSTILRREKGAAQGSQGRPEDAARSGRQSHWNVYMVLHKEAVQCSPAGLLATSARKHNFAQRGCVMLHRQPAGLMGLGRQIECPT